MKTFGEKLRECRKAAGMTQEALAKKCGLQKQSISRYEKSEREPNLQTAYFIARALGVSLESLVDLPDEEYKGKDSAEQHELLMTLFGRLTPEAQALVVAQLRGITQAQQDPGDH